MKIIIVEDESIIRNGLVKHIKWKSLGISEIRVAANTQEALTICESYIPDIVVSDISMPGENGILLCRKLRKLFPDIEIIFVTGYADKEYLKAAIDLHAVRYVEKPINRKDISEAVQEAVHRYQKTMEHKEAQLHTLFIDSASFPINIRGKNVFRVGILQLGQKEGLAQIKQELTEGMDGWLRKYSLAMLMEISDPMTLSFLLGGEDGEPLEASARKEYVQLVEQILGEKIRWFLAMGRRVEGTEHITDSWQTARQVKNALAYLGWNHVAYSEDQQGSHRFETDMTVVEHFAEAVSGKKEDAAAELLNNFAQELEEKQIFLNGEIRHVYYALNLVIKQAELTLRVNDKNHETDVANGDFFEYVATFAEMNQYLQSRLAALFEDGDAQKCTYVVKKVMDYIWENYADSSLSIKILADHVYLTPTYLSNVFKRSAGLTIGQYMVDVRIDKAKRLMRDPQLKFYQVASMVGYMDANYFAKIFKKKTNMTPSEYKESLSVR